MARPLGHRQTKETATDKPDLRLPRHISTLPRTKAHGYVHSCMEHPVYVKITGPAGALLPGTEAPLVVHQKDARKLEACGILPRGVTLELSPYKSAGLLKFRESGTTATPQGRDMSITDLSALDALLQLLMAVRPRGVAPRVAAQSPDSAGRNSDDEPEPPLPDTHEAIAAASAIDEDPRCRDESPTVRLALINARLGQGGYRQRMLKLWEGRCSVTGCAEAAVLIASHAIPWIESSNTERLDEFNGLLLTASLDRLFDQGLISFSDDGEMLRKASLCDADLACLGIGTAAKLRHVLPRHHPYLAAHRSAFCF
jgi:hypothetical protein